MGGYGGYQGVSCIILFCRYKNTKRQLAIELHKASLRETARDGICISRLKETGRGRDGVVNDRKADQ